ncbi:hypothetical protein M9H77_30360 [Catharanthus roseus]|uniref:Uncharacterized protein n=1 Tax=Catharanthus roseus TaxID=4058 RepID=A0ACB9ZX07_CATRO|nr:hypothetical protein M9H77_30360 [Catharanthus roseus]
MHYEKRIHEIWYYWFFLLLLDGHYCTSTYRLEAKSVAGSLTTRRAINGAGLTRIRAGLYLYDDAQTRIPKNVIRVRVYPDSTLDPGGSGLGPEILYLESLGPGLGPSFTIKMHKRSLKGNLQSSKRSLKTTKVYEDEVIKLKTLKTRRMVRDSL